MKNKKNIFIAVVGIIIVVSVVLMGFKDNYASSVNNSNFKANNQEIVIGAVLSETGMASMLEMFLSYTESSGAMKTEGTSGLMRAMTPCLSSALGWPSAWR